MNARGERILIFGDSLSHHGSDTASEIWDVDQDSNRTSSQPGDLLGSLLLEQGASAVRIDANVGRSAYNFWQGNASHQYNSAQDLIASDQIFSPTKLVVMLGTNELGMNLDFDAQAMTAIKNSFPGVEAWAIGPPIFADANRNAQANDVYTMLQNVFGVDHVIDARPLSTTVDRAGDGVHFQPASAKNFAFALANQLLATNPIGILKTVLLGVAGIAGLIGAGLLWSRHQHRMGLSGDQTPGGKAHGMNPEDFDPYELEEGQEVEFEHTSDPYEAEKIAMDHLAEDPSYYEKLKKVHLDGVETEDTVAWTVKDSAKRAPYRWAPNTKKVFISDVYQQIVDDGRDDGMTLDEFKHELVKLHKAGQLKLSRADLVAAMPAERVEASETDANGATFHFVTI